MRSGTMPGPNLETIAAAAEAAAAAGADYLQTPEMSVAFARNRDELALVAEPFEGNSAIERLRDVARSAGIVLHVGSLAIALEDGRFANRSVLIDRDGGIAASYDKIHLYDADPPGDRVYRESATYRGGELVVTAKVAGIGLGLTICYDVRFPALYTALAATGVELIAVPSAFTVPTGRAHWEVLLRARAIETGAYIVAAAQGGLHENGRSTYGHSMIVDPWGTVVGSFDHDEPGLLFADIEPQRVADARARIPALANARPFSLSVNTHGASLSAR